MPQGMFPISNVTFEHFCKCACVLGELLVFIVNSGTILHLFCFCSLPVFHS